MAVFPISLRFGKLTKSYGKWSLFINQLFRLGHVPWPSVRLGEGAQLQSADASGHKKSLDAVEAELHRSGY